MRLRELQRKYRENMLTTEELQELRSLLHNTDDAVIGKAMLDEWERNDGLEDRLSVRRMKKAIDAMTGKTSRSFWPITVAAAATALLVGLGIGLMSGSFAAHESISTVTTAYGGIMTVELPDGSLVELDSKSVLTYSATDFSADERIVELEGRAYFNVTKDARHPFKVILSGAEIEVLGTSFNLDARSDSPIVEITLDSGSVRISSDAGSEATISPGEQVLLNRDTGSMEVLTPRSTYGASAWLQNELVFDDSPLEDVFREFHRIYGMEIQIESGLDYTDSFTGNLPTSNVIEAVDILCKALSLRASYISADKVLLHDVDKQ